MIKSKVIRAIVLTVGLMAILAGVICAIHEFGRDYQQTVLYGPPAGDFGEVVTDYGVIPDRGEPEFTQPTLLYAPIDSNAR